jgi:16S rRNA U516 pseudouridylate synthase RsuA-like enzyme
MRLQKFLSRGGVASRRAAEELIREGHVSVDDRIVTEMGFQSTRQPVWSMAAWCSRRQLQLLRSGQAASRCLHDGRPGGARDGPQSAPC